MKKKVIILAAVLVIAVLIIVLINGNKSQSEAKEEISYKLVYMDGLEPGSKYEIEIGNTKVYVKETNYCSAVDCSPNVEERELNYSREGIQKAKDLVEELKANNIDLNDIQSPDITAFQRVAIKALARSENDFVALKDGQI